MRCTGATSHLRFFVALERQKIGQIIPEVQQYSLHHRRFFRPCIHPGRARLGIKLGALFFQVIVSFTLVDKGTFLQRNLG